MSFIQKLAAWHDTKIGLITYIVLEIGLAYVFASWAIDKGNPLDWFLTVVLLIGAIHNIVKLILKVTRKDA